jgi:long-subunit acyl-CoA synthetase (AMP-forming)
MPGRNTNIMNMAICRHQLPPELERRLSADMGALNTKLEDHEKAAKLLIAQDAWAINNGFMTPTMKVKRMSSSSITAR